MVFTLAAVAILASAASLTAAGDEPGLSPEYSRLKDRAEAFCAEGSYARARQLYERASDLDLPAAEARWVAFRVADMTWRAQAGSRTHDNTVFEKARRQLDEVITEIKRPEDRDRVWAEAQESLGDFWWTRRDSQNWGQGWNHYQQALDWWAGRHDIDLARRRYLDMVWSMADPEWQRHYGGYRHYNIPLEVLENARRIARSGEDRSRAHYMLAMGLRQYGGSWQQRKRIESEFESAIDFGAKSPWYDDALYHYAQWLASNGRVILEEGGQWRQEPDFVKAVELYRRLVREFKKGRTQYWDDARNQIKQITSPQLSAGVSNIFLPGSEIRFSLSWRNLGGIDLALYRVDLTRDVDPTTDELQSRQWISHIDATGAEKVKAWRLDTKDAGEHKWGSEEVRLEEHLPPGAYLLVATSGGKFARELVLVTDASVVIKAWRGKVLAYVCDALDGSPIPGARVHLWNLRYTEKRWTGTDVVKETDEDGMCRFEVDTRSRGRERFYGYLVTAAVNGRQAFAIGGGFGSPQGREAWKIYATTDRPAYRPNETVHWKVTARTNDGSGYATPADQRVHYEISGPRGKVEDGELTLNAFGSAWSDLELGESLALGEYQVSFRKRAGGNWIGSATLFRLEEYKLPEFEVAVTTPTDDAGRNRAYRLGETVEADITATYYFGGPVANANVQVLVYQKPFYHWWSPPREYPWYYSGRQHQGWWGGPGQIIKQETLKTDDSGRAVLSFETPMGGGQDLEYRVEARVTDASRREITGATSVRVTRQRYYVHPHPRRNLYEPGDTVEVDFKAIDANDQPVSVEGTVKVTRDRWVEIWIDPAGREVTGWNLRAARKQFKVFPPPPADGDQPWQVKYRGYSSQEILTRKITTDAEGEATLSFTSKDEGYYRVSWASVDDGDPISAETTVWVADRDTIEIGYRQGGVEIVVDKDTFRAGQTAAVMLSVPTNDRYVLFSVEGDDMHS
jgi:tetratricopeptide (TPR) repeat protein